MENVLVLELGEVGGEDLVALVGLVVDVLPLLPQLSDLLVHGVADLGCLHARQHGGLLGGSREGGLRRVPGASQLARRTELLGRGLGHALGLSDELHEPAHNKES